MYVKRGLPGGPRPERRAASEGAVRRDAPRSQASGLELDEVSRILRKFIPRETLEEAIADLDRRIGELGSEVARIRERIESLKSEYESKVSELEALKKERAQYKALLDALFGGGP